MSELIAEAGSSKHPSDAVTLVIDRRLFFKMAQYSIEYVHDTEPTSELFGDLKNKGVDLFTFVQRSFITHGLSYLFPREDECIALLKLKSFDYWWRSQINKKTRWAVRKATKERLTIDSAKINKDFVKSAYRIYNETPIRQGRRYTGYGLSLQAVSEKFRNLQTSEVLGAYFDGELIGILWLICGDKVARIRSFVSLIKHRDKGTSNALMAEGVRRCCERDFGFIIYEKMGYLPGLDSFKRHNGFEDFITPRYFVPLSKKGVLAIKLRVHKDIQYSLSPTTARALLPIYSRVSRAIPTNIWRQVAD